MKILIIEDEVLIQKSLIRLLAKRNLMAEGVVSAREAIDKILHHDYDKILCDLMLQDLSGFDVIEAAKRKYSAKEISSLFIIMTAYSSPQILDKAHEYGCIILQKPFEEVNKVIDIIAGENS